ncbi:HemK/PrmC family methyltransferase [Campylobacter canadensis]|uniref:peptide chain release factor N(5)-glutamine methyltransferase n=1 Tax=Campylobacter canadensis TaxID=449520 RepID=A0ABS7WPC7_9BACT|nr:HemK/PrmC family methyltransferase [Campylobacter canadensis]MBZ7986625.1 peptide chain release factor N(5)-glutamine methyltransferase [Campylobacter canadensis]MBZ7993970.1 peptide chain release factor N(5)-glutamine methyltransferase [Campylobacter canadensis]MBZ7996286.1 peptide chain release factor N(5)-glutamine methyltransferase [Campylobacter canadensis]MBZ7997661.1 peptide chain release factor N(5)-glutamine methyltransferase [Campylobacter canadensis]MBZ7999302.1 peptide chain rel
MHLLELKQELKKIVDLNTARNIIMQYLNIDLLEYSAFSKELSNKECRDIFKIAALYKKNIPLQYIFQHTYINDMLFYCKKGVLIPREDTQILINASIEFARDKNINNILEIGFGSAIISIILSLNLKAKIDACDINKKALSLAKKNALLHKANVNFFIEDYKNVDFSKYDFIVSNPPYIANDYKLDEFVLKEPKEALFGGELGSEILFDIINKAAINKVKFLACEFGYDQKDILKKHLESKGYKAIFFKDLSSYYRAFVAERI